MLKHKGDAKQLAFRSLAVVAYVWIAALVLRWGLYDGERQCDYSNFDIEILSQVCF